MKWEGNRESENVDDRRGETGGDGGGGGGFSLGGGSLGIGGVVIALVASYFFGVDPSTILNMMSGGSGGSQVQQQAPKHAPPASDHLGKFVQVVLADTEDTWTELFRAQGKTYTRPRLEIFDNPIRTACGSARSATGPFYCPGDQMIYIDLNFYRVMQERFHVSSEFAEAYVIAHEVGHHVQNLLGITQKVDAARQQHASESQLNALSVKVELQADCLAGVWANHANQARSILEKGDVEAALKTASAIGDDALQRQSQGQVVPDSFTHGTSAQRVHWFNTGIESGDMAACNTFAAGRL